MFLKINSSEYKSSDALLQVVEEELTLENRESIPPPSEPVQNSDCAEELRKILEYPGIPIQTPVPLRFLINEEEREVLLPPARPKLEKRSSEITLSPPCPSSLFTPILLEPKICRNARSPGSPIYWVCTQIIFDLVPPEWFSYPVHTWEKSLPDCEESLKKVLLEFVKEKELGPNNLHCLAKIGLDNVKNIVKTCSKDALSLLANKEPLNVEELIRINVERNPTLNTTAFITKLHSLIVLINKTNPSWDELIFHTNFLKEISDYPSPRYTYSINDSDKIYLFVTQLQRSNLKRPIFLENKEKPSPIYTCSSFFNHLNEISSILGEELHQDLIDQIQTYISYSQNDERPPQYAEFQRGLWLKCGDALFGAFPFFKDLPIFKEVCSVLKSLPLLTTHPKAVELINNTLFEGKSEVLSVMLYKSWWFGAYLRDLPNSVAAPHSVAVSDPLTTRHSLAIPHSLADRMVDWYMQQFLESSRTWEISKTVQLVKFLFLENHPLVPFNIPRAERMFFSLKLDTNPF